MSMHAIGVVGLVVGWAAEAATAATDDDALAARMAECRGARDGDCLLALAAFDEAAGAFEQAGRWERATGLRQGLGDLDRAYADALASVKAETDDRITQSTAADALALAELLGSDDAARAGFYRRYLRDLGHWAAQDSRLVAHARLGAALMARSCSLRTFHGACVELHRERRRCPELCDEHGNCAYPAFPPAQASDGTYSVEVAVGKRRDQRLVREANHHLRIALDPRELAAAKSVAAVSRSRARDLANAATTAVFARTLPDLDRFLALGGVPEALTFEQPTAFDSPCQAEQKAAAFTRSSERFLAWLREKLTLMERLRDTWRAAATEGGPEAAVMATALHAFVMETAGRALLTPDDRLLRCPLAGFVDGPDGSWWADDVEGAVSVCQRVANRYGIDNQYSRYCRIDLGDRPQRARRLPCPGRPLHYCGDAVAGRSVGLLTEISPSSLFMEHVRDDQENASFRVPVSLASPREKPKPAPKRCPATRSREPEKGVLQVYDDADLARFFARYPPLPTTLLDQLAARFPPPFSP
jgi:hypothetical protein